MNTKLKKQLFGFLVATVLSGVLVESLVPPASAAQINLGGDKKKKKEEEEKPQFPRHKFKGTILSIKLEERRFLLNTSEGLAVLVQVDDKTKMMRRRDKKGKSDLLFADLQVGDAMEVNGPLPPSRILQAEKIVVEAEAKK